MYTAYSSKEMAKEKTECGMKRIISQDYHCLVSRKKTQSTIEGLTH